MRAVKNLFYRAVQISNVSTQVECSVPPEILKKNAQSAVRNSQQAKSTIQKFADLWIKSSNLGGDSLTVEMGPIKSEDRFIEKAVARYDGDVSQVSDGCRNQILITSPAQLKSLKIAIQSPAFVQSCEAKGIKIQRVEDFFERPTKTRWRGLVIKTEIDLGKGRSQKCETRVIPKDWVEEYEKTHTYLVNTRALEDLAKAQHRDLTPTDQARVQNYRREAQQIHDSLAARDGYASLEIAKRKPADLRLIMP